ncbi:MAG UNVERIFIED_CONTAM: signal recognition particle-docking protein FtsY, partial [Thermobifida fusca]
MDYTIVVIAIAIVALVAVGGALLIVPRRQVGKAEQKPELDQPEGRSGAGATAVLEPEETEGATAVAEPEAPPVPA